MRIGWFIMLYDLKFSRLDLFFFTLLLLFAFFVVYDIYLFTNIQPIKLTWLDDVLEEEPVLEKDPSVGLNYNPKSKDVELIIFGAAFLVFVAWLIISDIDSSGKSGGSSHRVRRVRRR